MLTGISGSLIAGGFLETALAPEFAADPELAGVIRGLHRWSRRVQRVIGPASSVRVIADVAAIPLFSLLGYEVTRLEPHRASLAGTVTRDRSAAVVLCVTPDRQPLDVVWREMVRAGRMTGARWACVFNGRALRLIDARRSWARHTLEFDVTSALNDEQSARIFAALVRAAGLADDAPGALDRLVHRSESHGLRVCTSLGTGVIDALTALATALDAATPRKTRAATTDRMAFEQAITLVYRLLFLLFAEARAIVPTWHRLYRDSYSIDALVERLGDERTARGAWKALQAISRLAYAGCRAGDLVVTPFNGRLFSPRHTPLAESARLPDTTAASVLNALATTRGTRGLERVAYADLDVEQLGAVYEHVLEFEPARVDGKLTLTRTSHDRKATGSFYTPRAMTDFLVRRALFPLIANKSAHEILRLRVLDPAMGSGAFLVSACRYLAAAVERALVDAGQWRGDTPAAERANLRRLIAQRCLFGVDRNPRAVQLARLSLWLCTLSSDRPLTFLDHHLATGNSLLGAWFTSLPRAPRAETGRRSRGEPTMQQTLDLEAAGYLSHTLLPERRRITVAPEDSPAAVREKERALANLTAPGTPLEAWKRAADLWCAAWFWESRGLSPGVYADVVATLMGRASSLARGQVAALLERVAATAVAHQLFHWELEFPEVYFTADGRRDPAGGFDAVIGNPPWDVLRADAGDEPARRESRVSHTAQLRFLRDSAVYRYSGRGHANCYQLFVERVLQLARPGARIALIVPSGLATDHGSGHLRRHLLDSVSIDRLFGFDNRHGIFPIHRDMKFLLLTGTTAAQTARVSGSFARTDPAWLDRLPDAANEDPPDARAIVLSRTFLEQLDPEHLSLPWLRERDDLDLLAALTTLPRLDDPAGWHVTFGRELNATDDRPHFVARVPGDNDLVPIVEGKHLEPFRALVDGATRAVPSRTAATLVDPARTFRRARLAYRDVASATNRVTLIAALLPRGIISTHTVFCAKTSLAPDDHYCLLALLNSLVANYLVRLQVTTHVTTALMARLPVPRPEASAPEFGALASLARRLERVGAAGDEGAYARLNAIAARVYGLSAAQYGYVVSTFPLLSRELRDLCVRAFGDLSRPAA
jgi:hypothetical protein